MNKYTVIYLVSVLTAFIGTAMLVCLPVGFLMNDPHTVLLEFSFCSILTIAAGVGGALLSGKRREKSAKTGLSRPSSWRWAWERENFRNASAWSRTMGRHNGI